jgi:hypothetical protein
MTTERRISAHDFVRAMLLAGYRLVGTTATGRTLLTKDDVELWVAQRDELPEGVILTLLDQARMTPLFFVTLLERLGGRSSRPPPSEASSPPAHRAFVRDGGKAY